MNSWLDTMRARHSDPADLRVAVAGRLYQAHNISKGAWLPTAFDELPLASTDNWLRRADNLLARDITADRAA